MRSHWKRLKFDRTPKVVLYPAQTVAGYGHIYSFGRSGITVVALSNTYCINFTSRYLKEKYVVPDPTEEMDGFIAWLIEYGKDQKHKPVLILAEDVYAYAGSLFQEQLKPFYLYPWVALNNLDAYFSKRSMFRDAELAGLAQPRTVFAPLSDADIDAWHDYPAVMKPTVSRFTFKGRTLVDTNKFPRLFGGKAVIAADAYELRQYCIGLQQEGIDYCVQQFIPGLDNNLVMVGFVADLLSKISASFMFRKYRQQPADFGTVSVAVAEYVPELYRLTEQYCRQTGYTGPGTMEFKWDEESRRWLFIENNPRLGFCHSMATHNGVNLALQQYLLSTGQGLFKMGKAPGTKCWIDILGDVRGLQWRQKRPEWRIPWWNVVRPYLYFNEAVFNWSDPRPGFLRLYNRWPPRRFILALIHRLSKRIRHRWPESRSAASSTTKGKEQNVK
jgi:predicted ATP-grasp superfamily ATP-dependent carboligase